MLTIAMLGAPAAAERTIVVEVAADGPFTAAELTEALRVRVSPTGAPLRIRVTATDDAVRVDAGGTARDLELGGRRGADAARLVAIAASDLVLDDLAATPPPPPRPPPTFAIGALGGASAFTGTLAGGALDFTFGGGPWLFDGSVGGGALTSGPIHGDDVMMRLGVGYRIGWLDLLANATVAPLIVRDGAGDFTVLLGGGASARVRIPVADRVHAVIAAGADVFATRTEYTFAGLGVTETPLVAPWFAAGVELAP